MIGKRCRHVSKAEAASVVFGYAAGNDVSVRDWQFHTAQWIVGKSFDTHAPIGPWIVTSDEIGDPHTLGIRAFVNGERRQNSNTRNLVFNVFDQIAYLSQAMTLMPGDMIFTGTPGGVGMAMKPPSFLKAGDVVRTWDPTGLARSKRRCGRKNSVPVPKFVRLASRRGPRELLLDAVLTPDVRVHNPAQKPFDIR